MLADHAFVSIEPLAGVLRGAGAIWEPIGVLDSRQLAAEDSTVSP